MTTTKSEPLQDLSVLSQEHKSTQKELDGAISVLQAHKDEWTTLQVSERIALLDNIIKDWALIMDQMVSACAQAKGAGKDNYVIGEEWILGPYSLMRYLGSLRRALADIKAHGRPQIPGPVRKRPDGQVVVQIFPQIAYDRAIYNGVTLEVWMQPGVTEQELYEHQAWAYSGNRRDGKVSLVFGAGNLSSMGPMDILYWLFVEGNVTLFKLHSVNAYLGPFIEKGFKALIDRGFLRVVHGETDVGAYLCNHSGIDNIYMVGSDKTFEAIVFGTGPEGQERKLRNEPIIDKPVTAELGNISPFILVPGSWSKADLAYHAEHFVSSIVNNAGCNCSTPRVLFLHAGWEQRHEFMDEVRKLLAKVRLRTAYYPGSQDRYQRFVEAHPGAEKFGTTTTKQQLPWTLITDVDSDIGDDICFTSEAFCSVVAATAIEAKSASEYLDKVVEFCNERLWGTLCTSIMVHPGSLKDPEIAVAFDRAIANLRYGTVSINHLPSYAYCLGLSPWGAFPGQAASDIQSGNGRTINALMLANTQKTVVRVPFRIKPKPAWFVTQGKKSSEVFRRLAELDVSPSIWKVVGIITAAMKPSKV